MTDIINIIKLYSTLKNCKFLVGVATGKEHKGLLRMLVMFCFLVWMPVTWVCAGYDYSLSCHSWYFHFYGYTLYLIETFKKCITKFHGFPSFLSFKTDSFL